ncbi:Heptahelical transmembrane protein 4 [Coccomyxa sp. Obi]|nr:Heptahelical transmembrane protein 4 [Coccomyxa sp. Obi]
MREPFHEVDASGAGKIAALNVPRRRKVNALKLAAFHSLPESLRDNEYITKYYRVNYTGKQTIRSLFGLHNETGNIWTHFLGFLLFAVLTFVTIYAQPAPLRLGAQKLIDIEQRVLLAGRLGWQEFLRAEQHVEASLRSGLSRLQDMNGSWDALAEDLKALEDRAIAYGADGLRGLEGRYAELLAVLSDSQWPTPRWPVYVFLAGAMVCLFTSAFCHLFACCSWHVAETIWKYDYAGIVVLIVASFIPPVYYGFLCEPLLRNFYLISTCLMGLLTVCVTLLSFFQTQRFRTFRAALFATLGLWGIAPSVHVLLLHGSEPQVQTAFWHNLTMGAIYLLGAMLFALRVPERWSPGKFDLAFNSHQLFHVCVVVAAVVHYRGIRVLLAYCDGKGGCVR